MNSELYKKLIKAIYLEDNKSLKKLAELIIKNENDKGHKKLAEDLLKIIDKTKQKKTKNNILGQGMNSLPSYSSYMGTTNIPTSRRNNTPLLSYIPYEELDSDTILNDDVEARISSIEKEYLAKDRLTKYNLKPKQKILFYGHPGCGKTMTAGRIAKNLRLPLLKVRFDSLISSYLGESSMNLRAVFDYCKKEPVVLLLDECDFIAKSRTINNAVGEIPRIVNMLLLLLDEYNSEGLVIAATNLEISLDEALFRRFDDVIEIPLPSEKEIELLLKKPFKNIKTDSKINFEKLAKKLHGNSAANIVLLMNNAAKICILKGEKVLKENHIMEILNNSNYKII